MDLDRFDKCWFAIQVRPRYEFLTAGILRSKGFEEFMPTYKVKRQWSDRRKELEMPLFPGYVFCRFDAQVRAPIVTTPGVIRILGGEIAIPDNEIEAIQTVVEHGIPAEPCPNLKVGTRVQVLAGPLAGVRGILMSYKNQSQLILSVTLVKNAISVEVDESNVTAVPESARSISAKDQAIRTGAPGVASRTAPLCIQ